MTKKVLALLLAFSMVFSCAACGSKEESGTTAEESSEETSTASGKTELNVRISDALATLDPQNWSIDSDFQVTSQIHEPLYRLADDTTEIPVLATGYTVSEDGLAYTFTLRDDVYFTNGEKMTASDVKFSIERTMASAYQSSNVATVASVDADDAGNTVTVNLSATTPGLIAGISRVLIVNQKFVEENADENGNLGMNACGTGPFMYSESIQDVSTTLVANPDYRDGAPSIETLNFLIVVDENTAITAFQAGELDIAYFSSANWDNLVASGQFNTAEMSTNHVSYIMLNTEQAPFDNKLVRQAIACATNREDIILMTQNGRATVADTVATSLMVGFPDVKTAYGYDPERAKELLAEAGYPDGLDIGEIQVLSGGYLAEIGVVLQQQLAEVGITATVSNLEANALITNCMSGTFGIATMGQTNTADMDWLSTYYGSEYINSMNMARYNNPDVDAKLAVANTCMDPEERIELYREILEIVDEDCPYVPIYNVTKCCAWAKDLTFTPSVRGNLYDSCTWN